MPFYEFKCCNKKPILEHKTFAQYDAWDFPKCECGLVMQPRVNTPALYGLMRCKDDAFSDAEEATGQKITSTKDIDRLEKAGVIRAVTNPSRARIYKDKQYAERKAAFKKKMGMK